MIDFVYTVEMTDSIFFLDKIKERIKENHPILIYTKGIFPIEILEHNQHVGINVTITGWGSSWLEPNVLISSKMLKYFNELVNKIGTDRVRLRIDPGVPTEKGAEKACSVLKEIEKPVYTMASLIQMYSNKEAVFKKLGIDLSFYSVRAGKAWFPEKIIAKRWLERLIETRRDFKNYISLCGMPYEVEDCLHSGCVDEKLLKAIGVTEFEKIDCGKQRPGCKCVIKKKQAVMGECHHGCKYCYAQFQN